MRLKTEALEKFNLKSILIAIAAGAAIAAFALTGLGTQIGKQIDPNTAAQVGSLTVPMRDLRRQVEYMNRLLGANASEDARKATVQRALENLIYQKVLQQAALDIGWEATEVEIAFWIRTSGYFVDPDTGVFDAKAYRKALRSGRVNEAELSGEARQAIAANKMNVLFNLPVPVPAKLVESYGEMERTLFSLEYVEIEPPQADLDRALKEEVAKYLADSANEATLQKAYDDRKSDFVHPEQLRLRTILVSHKDAKENPNADRTVEEGRALAQTALDRLTKGEDFSKVATEINDDPTARAGGGELGWVDEVSLGTDAFVAARALNAKNKLSGIIETTKGFRIFAWIDARAAIDRGFADVREELAREKVKAAVSLRVREELEVAAQEAIDKDINTFKAFVADRSIAWKAVEEPVKVSSRFVGTLGYTTDVQKHLFSLKVKGDMIPLILNVGGKKVVFRLVERTMEQPREGGDNPDLAKQLADGFQTAFSNSTIAYLYKDLNQRGKIVPNPQLQQTSGE